MSIYGYDFSQNGATGTVYYLMEIRPQIWATDSGSVGTMRCIDCLPDFTRTAGSASSQISEFIGGNFGSFAPAQTITNAVSHYCTQSFVGQNPTGTITNAYGYYYDGGTASTGTISNAYGLYVTRPTFGSTGIGAFIGGNSFIGSIDVSTPTSPFYIGTSLTGSNVNGLNIQTVLWEKNAGSNAAGIRCQPNFSNSTGGNQQFGVLCLPSFGCRTGGTLTNVACYLASNTLASHKGTISNAYGFLFDGGTDASSGANITSNYGAYLTIPAGGIDKYGMQITSASVTATGNGSIYGLFINPNMGCGAGTVTNMYNIYVNPRFTANVGTITNAHGMFIEAGTGAGTISNSYGLWVKQPLYGTTKKTVYVQCDASANASVNGLTVGNGTYELRFGVASTGVGWFGATNVGVATIDLQCYSKLVPVGNKALDLGASSARWNNIFSGIAVSAGTSRLAPAKTQCCGKNMTRGTGISYILGEEADYIPVMCLDCGHYTSEAVRHRQSTGINPPSKIEFLGFRVNQISGNSRCIQILFDYGSCENSTAFTDVEFDNFMAMTDEEKETFLFDVGLREWNAMEEVRIFEQECKGYQRDMDTIAKTWKNKDLLKFSVKK